MNKKDLIKLALIGVASGVCLAAQSLHGAESKKDLAMSKCTKSNKDHSYDDDDNYGEDELDGWGGMDTCSGDGGCGGEDGCDHEDTSMTREEKMDMNGRNETRKKLYTDDDKKMKSKRDECGRFY